MINWKRLFYLIVAFAIMAGLANLALSSFGPKVYVEQESVSINRQKLRTLLSNEISRYKNGDIAVIDFSSIKTPFLWDRLYVFEPYTNLSEIENVLGKSFNKETCFRESWVSDGVALLVFTNNGQVMQCLDYGRNKNDFAYIAKYETGLLIEQARFIIDLRGNVVWVGDQ
jgi:hypothetical protein